MALRVDDVDLVRDRALVERFQEGDPAAFETLYKRYFDRLTRFCQKRVGDRHEAEEIAQEAFVRALGALPTFEGERRFYPWMTVIAGRLCVDTHRRRGRSEPTAAPDLGVIEGGQERIVDAVDVAILAEALGRLAPRHREVLDLREQQGWSYQQIADHYGVTLGTVEALLFRARKALRREFLAVVGDERSWAALPVVGLLLRRLASLKARLAAWANALPAVGTPAIMAAALAVTALTGAVGVAVLEQHQNGGGRPSSVHVGGAPSLEQAELISANVVEPPAAPAAAHSAAVGTNDQADGREAESDRLLAPPAPGVIKATTQPVDDQVSPVDGFDGDSGSDLADYQPLSYDIADEIHAGVDPDQVRADVEKNIEHYCDDLTEGNKP